MFSGFAHEVGGYVKVFASGGGRCGPVVDGSTRRGEFFAAFADETDGQGGPAGLVGCAESFASLGVEVFVEEQEVLPIGRIRVACGGSEAGAVSVGVGEEEGEQAVAEVGGDLAEGGGFSGAGRVFELQ